VRPLPLLAFLLVPLAASCAKYLVRGNHSAPCSAGSSFDEVPFDSMRVENFAGRFRLTMVSDWEDEAGRFARGTLVLQPTDTFRRYGERAIVATRQHPFSGWLEMPSVRITMFWDNPREHPDKSSVLFNRSGHLALGAGIPGEMLGKESMITLDAGSTNLDISSVSPTSFSGTWHSDFGLIRLMKNGRTLPNPRGHFCAVREQG